MIFINVASENFLKRKKFFHYTFNVSYLLFFLDINDLDVNVFLGPFLEVIRSEETTGPMTGVALSAVNKFLSYGLLGMTVT